MTNYIKLNDDVNLDLHNYCKNRGLHLKDVCNKAVRFFLLNEAKIDNMLAELAEIELKEELKNE
jgi:hypothetical protein